MILVAGKHSTNVQLRKQAALFHLSIRISQKLRPLILRFRLTKTGLVSLSCLCVDSSKYAFKQFLRSRAELGSWIGRVAITERILVPLLRLRQASARYFSGS